MALGMVRNSLGIHGILYGCTCIGHRRGVDGGCMGHAMGRAPDMHRTCNGHVMACTGHAPGMHRHAPGLNRMYSGLEPDVLRA